MRSPDPRAAMGRGLLLRGWQGWGRGSILKGWREGGQALADLGFLEGVTLGTRTSIEGVWAYGRIKFERL